MFQLASIVGELWLPTSCFEGPLDELSVLTVVANVFAHGDRRPYRQAVA